MIDFDSDVSILQATVMDGGRAYIVLPDGTKLDTDPSGLESLAGKMSWTAFVREQHKYLEENPRGPAKVTIKEIPALAPKHIKEEDPMEYAYEQVEHYSSECESLADEIKGLEGRLAVAQTAYKKWKKIVEALESDE